MALAIYGNSQKYGAAAGNKYGRIEPAIAIAQAQTVRQTGLRVTIQDSFPNQWESVAGTTLPIPASFYSKAYPATSQSYGGYRLQMAMCALSNGTIVRVRVGDGTLSDRNIYKQEITDPTVASQWTTWSLAYSGTHYAVGIAPASASTYYIYSAKSDGVYKDNVLKRSRTGIVEISTVTGEADAMYVIVVGTHGTDKRRTLEIYYSPDIETTNFTADDNYDWYRTEVTAYYDSTRGMWRAQVAAFHSDPRSTKLAESLVVGPTTNLTDGDFSTPPRLLRGFGSQAGSNAIVHPVLVRFSDGFFYLFYTESRYDASGDKAISANTIFWQRSKDGKYWTEPTAIGFDSMPNTGFAVVERSGYLYLANNGAVWRRPVTTTQDYDISNYVKSVSMEMPRGNGEGTGNIEVANPAGVNDSIKNFADKEVKIEVGIRVADGSYKYTEFNRWWVDSPNQQREGKINRFSVSLYDLWRRLDIQLRDTYNFVGQVVWKDIVAGGRNKLFNYYPRTCTGSIKYTQSMGWYCTVSKNVENSFLLYTGWKGHNCTVSARWRGGTIPTTTRWGVVARYQDPKNYIWAYIYNGTLYLARVVNGVRISNGSYSVGTNLKTPTIQLTVRWGKAYVAVNGTQRISGFLSSIDYTKPGYSGVKALGTTSYMFDRFTVNAWEAPLTTNDLLRTALAMGGFHDVVVAGGEDQQLAVVWGPQTDLKTPSAAIDSLLKQYKLDLAWHNGFIHIGQFKSIGPVKTLQNEVVKSDDEIKTGRRINLAVVDGQEDTYIEIDGADTRSRGRQIPGYFDLPELTNYDSVRNRAIEEVRKGVVGESKQGEIPLLFDLWRMDPVTWIDPNGESTLQRIQGFTIEIRQDQQPLQRMVLDMSPAQ